jgi:hypothetical protein
VIGGNAVALKLNGDGRAQIDESFAAGGGTNRSLIAQKQMERLDNFGTDFKGGRSDAGADGGENFRIGSDGAELIEGAGHDSGHDAAPAGVDGGDPSAVFGGQQHRSSTGAQSATRTEARRFFSVTITASALA